MAILVALALSGCQAHQTLRLDILIDTSGSTAGARLAQPALKVAVASALRDTDMYGPTVGLWRFDAVPACVYESQPTAAVALARLSGEQFALSTDRMGTRPDLALTELAAAWQRDNSSVLALLMVTDGEMTVPEAMAKAVQRIADEPRLKVVWIVGVMDGQRAEVHRIYAPLARRLTVAGQSREDALDGMRTFVGRIEGEVL